MRLPYRLLTPAGPSVLKTPDTLAEDDLPWIWISQAEYGHLLSIATDFGTSESSRAVCFLYCDY